MTTDLRSGLLASLGLPADASAAQVRAVQNDLRDFLDTAPETLQPWACAQLATADAAYTVLSGSGDIVTEEGDDEDGRPPGPRLRARSRTTGRSSRSPVTVVLALLAVVVVVVGVYFTGERPSASNPTAGPTATSGAPATARPLDESAVAALKAKLAKNPADEAALRALVDTYYASAYYTNASQWQAKLVELRPKDADARFVLGATLANTGDSTGAEKAWQATIRLDPAYTEAYYNLGILYLNADPPDSAKATSMWRKVVDLDPDSSLAATVTSHLDRFASASSSSPAG